MTQIAALWCSSAAPVIWDRFKTPGNTGLNSLDLFKFSNSTLGSDLNSTPSVSTKAMNRTFIFLVAAAALLLTAVLLGKPLPVAQPPPVQQVVQVPVVKTPPPVQVPLIVEAPKSKGSLTLNGTLSQSTIAQGTSDIFATLDVSAVDVPGSARTPVNLALVVDRSGSMSGNKIVQARMAANRLVDLLNENDRLSIVHYGTDVRSFAGVFATAENKARMHRYISGIVDEGGTNIGDGLEAGRAQLEKAQTDFRVNRLILLSDGQPTVGITSPNGLAKIVTRMRSTGISMTSLGVGLDFNEDLMQRLADVGGGSYGFINNSQAMSAVFEQDLSQAGTMVAREVTLKFTLPDGVVLREVFGRPTSQVGNDVFVTLPDFSARQVEKVVVRLVANASVSSGQSMAIGRYELDYTDVLVQKKSNETVSLSALVSNDREFARRSVDKSAYVAATRAQASTNYKVAADALERGDYGAAKGALQKNEVLFEDASDLVPESELKEEKASNQAMFGLSSAATSAPAMRQEAVKKMKVQTSQSSGRSADTVYAH
jgi:Ca-activated chloride channel homolog